MSRNICVYQDFLTDAHREQIRRTAADCGFSVRFFSEEESEAACSFLQTSEILYAHAPELLRAAPPTLQWYACSFAGVDPYCRDDGIFANPDCLLTNAAGAYGETISEHLLMVVLMLLRRMPEFQAGTRDHSWPDGLPVRSISGSTLTILGTGNIGTTFAKKVKALGAARVIGVSRSGIARDPVYDEMYPLTQLDAVLPRTEILVMALPGTPETIRILSRERIALLPPTAYVANVGRGSAVDQDALSEALNSGRLAGAALDVVEPEPLPACHPLWDTKNLIITPHISGNMTLGYTRDKAVEIFCEDLRQYAAGKPPAHLVNRNLGY